MCTLYTFSAILQHEPWTNKCIEYVRCFYVCMWAYIVQSVTKTTVLLFSIRCNSASRHSVTTVLSASAAEGMRPIAISIHTNYPQFVQKIDECDKVETTGEQANERAKFLSLFTPKSHSTDMCFYTETQAYGRIQCMCTWTQADTHLGRSLYVRIL